MKKIISIAFALLAVMTMNAAVNVDKVEPANWFVGMNNPSLQLMVYGKNIRSANVTTSYPGVTVKEVVRLDSPNYLLVYLDLSGAQAGKMKLNFTEESQKKTIDYELKARTMNGSDRIGFNSSAVLYMLMPDRFADGTG